MIEEILITYGPLGLWTATLLYERFKVNKNMNDTIKGNTIALTKVNEVMKKCQKN